MTTTGGARGKGAYGFDAATRHPDVDQGHMRVGQAGDPDQVVTGRGVADDLEAGIAVEQRDEGVTHGVVVVGDHDLDRTHGTPLLVDRSQGEA